MKILIKAHATMPFLELEIDFYCTDPKFSDRY